MKHPAPGLQRLVGGEDHRPPMQMAVVDDLEEDVRGDGAQLPQTLALEVKLGASTTLSGSLPTPRRFGLALSSRLCSDVSRRVGPLQYRAGPWNESHRTLDDVTFHTLQHTFASWGVMRGVTLKELQELLALAMTMRYAHLAPEHLRQAVTRLEGVTSTEPTKESAQEPVETVGTSRKSLK